MHAELGEQEGKEGLLCLLQPFRSRESLSPFVLLGCSAHVKSTTTTLSNQLFTSPTPPSSSSGEIFRLPEPLRAHPSPLLRGIRGFSTRRRRRRVARIISKTLFYLPSKKFFFTPLLSQATMDGRTLLLWEMPIHSLLPFSPPLVAAFLPALLAKRMLLRPSPTAKGLPKPKAERKWPRKLRRAP